MFTKILTFILIAMLLVGCVNSQIAGTNSTADTTTMPTTAELTSAVSVYVPDAADFHDYSSIEFGNIQVSDSINLRFFVGLFPGATEYWGSEKNPFYSEFILANFLSEFDSLVEFCEFNHQYQGGHHKLVFVFDSDIKNFQWVEMYIDIRFDEAIRFERNFYLVGDTLFSNEILKENQPFVTTVDFMWVYNHPRRGILFVDEYGNSRIFVFLTNNVGDDFPPWGIWESFDLK